MGIYYKMLSISVVHIFKKALLFVNIKQNFTIFQGVTYNMYVKIGRLGIIGVDKKGHTVKMRNLIISGGKNTICKPNCFCYKSLGGAI